MSPQDTASPRGPCWEGAKEQVSITASLPSLIWGSRLAEHNQKPQGGSLGLYLYKMGSQGKGCGREGRVSSAGAHRRDLAVGLCICNLDRNCHAACPWGCTNLHKHLQCVVLPRNQNYKRIIKLLDFSQIHK